MNDSNLISRFSTWNWLVNIIILPWNVCKIKIIFVHFLVFCFYFCFHFCFGFSFVFLSVYLGIFYFVFVLFCSFVLILLFMPIFYYYINVCMCVCIFKDHCQAEDSETWLFAWILPWPRPPAQTIWGWCSRSFKITKYHQIAKYVISGQIDWNRDFDIN